MLTINADAPILVVMHGTDEDIDSIKTLEKDSPKFDGKTNMSKQLYISTNIGKLVIVDIKSGKVKKILNIDNDKISRAFVQKQDMFLVRNNSIIKLN